MEKFDIIKESQLTEIKFESLSQRKTYAVFDLDEFFVYNEGELHSLTGQEKINLVELKRENRIENLLDHVQNEGTHFVGEFESMDDVLDFFNLKWKING
jgi:hypothetical protein